MKILRLGFKNLNSLVGEWQIDFSHPDYVSSGIFAITGPTGAGKTTILDAICVALYGQTPRLSRITQSENEIMSRQTGECFAEVEFETGKGRFRCHWSQHRSRKQADGQLQSPKHEIVDAVSRNVLESRLTAVARKVEDVTGMKFDQFTRSMLLAQGSFAAFLQARPDDRAPILEQITGTEIYSRISMKVHERRTEENKSLADLRADLNGMQLLSPEEEAVLRSEQTAKQLEERALSVSAVAVREARAWKERIALLEGEIAQLEEAWLSFEAKKLAAAPEIECLAQATRAMSLEGDYANIAAVRKQQRDEQSELTSAEEMLPKAQLGLQAAVDLLGQAELAFKKAQDEQQHEAESIRKTRALDLKLDEANSRLKGMLEDCEAIKLQCGNHRASITKYEGELQAATALLGESEAFLSAHHADAGLAEALTGMEQQIRTLKVLDGQYLDRSKKLDLQVSLSKSSEQVLQQANTAWAEASKAVVEAETRLGVLEAAGKTLLQGRELSSWREEAEILSVRQNRLESINDTLARIGETGKKLDALVVKLGDLEQKRQGLVGQEEDLARECGLRADITRQLQEKILLLNKVRGFEEERQHLLDGAPCPLCGSIEHPYAVGNEPKLDEAQQELDQAHAAYIEVSERLSSAKMDLAGVTKEIEQVKREQLEYLERQDLYEASCTAGFTELAVIADSSTRDTVIGVALESCRASLDKCRHVIREAEGKDKELLDAKTTRETARDSLNLYDKKRHAAELDSRSVVSEQERLKLDCETLRDDLDRALAEAERAFEPYGCKDITPKNTDEMFASLTARRNDYIQRMQEKERLEKALADLDAKKRQDQALFAVAEKNLSAIDERLTGSITQRDILSEQRRELFGERNPDSEEKRLAAALSQAGARREESLRDQNRLQHELSNLEQRIQKLTGAITGRTAQLNQLEAALQLRLTAANFADEAAFLLARLPQARFDELALLTEELQRNEVAIRTRRQDRAAALQLELAKKLSEKSLEQIKEENSVATLQLSDLQKSLGGIEQKLQQHAQQQQCQKDRLQAMEMQKKECARWEQLHLLIGSNDGKKFRNFAQGLTFELMVAHANRQLQKMSDRYILVRDNSEPLELNVIDNYQAGEIRSTKNLSGGESFIASLALSLGLSSMASRNVAVDSLFLDEGFGTLDEDALETALETLSGLQQDGKLIGVISHVPALKERIGTQIQVEAGNSGRSSLSGPGCRRVA